MITANEKLIQIKVKVYSNFIVCFLEHPEPCKMSTLVIPPNAAAAAVRELGGEGNIPDGMNGM